VHNDLQALREKFGARFGDMQITACESIFWPVYWHTYVFSAVSVTPLNVVEEGLLRLAKAGVATSDEIARLLGTGVPYVRILTERLSQTWGGAVRAPIQTSPSGQIETTTGIDECIRLCQRSVVDQREVTVVRDAIFNQWLDAGEGRVRIVRLPKPHGDNMKWLGPKSQASTTATAELTSAALSASGQERECRVEFDTNGALGWIEVRLAIYQADDGRRGRLLLFIDGTEPEPIDSLSERFEELLSGSDVVPLYFPDDRVGSSTAFWKALSAGIHTSKAEKQLHEQLTELSIRKDEYYRSRRARAKSKHTRESYEIDFTEAVLEATAWLELKSVSDAAVAYRRAVSSLVAGLATPCGASADEDPLPIALAESRAGKPEYEQKLKQHVADSQELCDEISSAQNHFGDDLPSLLSDGLWHLRQLARDLGITERATEVDNKLFQDLREAHVRIGKLRERVGAAPTVHPLETKDHAPLLKKALQTANHRLIIFSPWLKRRIVNSLLPDFHAALRRGCEIWIGYGMPPSRTHADSTDVDALESLKSLAFDGKLFLVDLSRENGSHAKEIVCDEDFYVATSYNWLSFDGTTRRETGLLVKGATFVRDRQQQCLSTLMSVLRRSEEAGLRRRAAFGNSLPNSPRTPEYASSISDN